MREVEGSLGGFYEGPRVLYGPVETCYERLKSPMEVLQKLTFFSCPRRAPDGCLTKGGGAKMTFLEVLVSASQSLW